MEAVWGIGGAAVGLLLGLTLYWPLKRWADGHMLVVWLLVAVGIGVVVLMLRSDPVRYADIWDVIHALGEL